MTDELHDCWECHKEIKHKDLYWDIINYPSSQSCQTTKRFFHKKCFIKAIKRLVNSND